MNELRTIAAMIAVAAWTVGCRCESKPVTAAPEPAGPAAAEPAKPAEPVAKAQGGSTPLVQMQQTMAVDQTVEKAAAQTDTSAGRKAQARIREIGKKKADMADDAGL